MKVKVSSAPLASIRAQAVIIPIFEDSEAPGEVRELDRQTAELVRRSRLTGKTGELTQVGAAADDDGFDVTLLVGLGARAALTLDLLRTATSAAVPRWKDLRVCPRKARELKNLGRWTSRRATCLGSSGVAPAHR
ncbi:MAG: hypothetical protein LH645_07430 [Actinomycetia bacterium]|nr:hypothetical protein [Actinomycetes bacterium]